MKPKRTRSRKPAVIPKSRWLAYATAGAASTLACASSADATIHYSGIIDHNFANGGFAGPLDAGFTLELSVDTGTQIRWGGEFGAAFIRGPNRAAGELAGYASDRLAYFWLSELPAGAFLPAQRFGEFCRWTSSCAFCGPSCGCNVCYATAEISGSSFTSPGTGFIGFVFSRDGAGAQYGWARVKKGGFPDYRFVLVDYAWGDPGEGFFTGQTTTSSTPPTPPPLRPNEQTKRDSSR
jgi:hypothetical protein